MNIQSLSVVVPNNQCINHCASCPSRMHDNNYPILINKNLPDFDLHFKDYMKRLEYARDNGCNTVMLTGTSEPQQNREFLLWFGFMMQMMKNPFKSIEMQCTGVLLDDDYIAFLRRHVGVTCIALSVFALHDNENMKIINPPADINTLEIARKIKAQGITLRMCLNLTKHFNMFEKAPKELFRILKEIYGADQVTLRVLYAGNDDKPENVWVRENRLNTKTEEVLKSHVNVYGNLLGKLPYGACKYGINGMSTVLDADSMGKETTDVENYKYLILRPDCKLYSSWDDPASLVF